MIKVSFEKEDDKLTLKIDGHAGQADVGHDIVCASCSILAYTVAQFVKEADRQGDLVDTPIIKLESGDAVISCEPMEEVRKMMQDIYLFAEVGYDLLAHSYPQYVELKAFGTAELP